MRRSNLLLVAVCAALLSTARAGDEHFPDYRVAVAGARLPAASAAALAPAPAADGAAALVLYVDDDAPLGGDGLSWATAFRHLQDALTAAGSGHVSIRVAQGLQRPDQAEGGQVVAGDRSATFALRPGLSLLGGYAGLGAPNPDAHDVAAYVSRLDGDLLGNDGPDFAGNAENSRHVVTAKNGGGASVLNGFRISAGRAELPVGNEGAGAGVLCPFNSGLTRVSQCTLTGNFAYGFGAGLYAHSGSAVTVQDCTVSDNRSDPLYGAGVTAYGSTFSVAGTTFTNNHATEAGGGLYGFGADVTLADCTFSGNRADSAAGSQGGGGAAILGVTLTASDCTWSGNSAPLGGGLAFSNGTLTLDGGGFLANSSEGHGGGLYGSENDSIDLRDLTFDGNSAGGVGGGLALATFILSVGLHDCTFTGNVAASSGGGAFTSTPVGGDLLVEGCRFVGNTSNSSGGGLDAFPVLSAVLTDSVFEDNVVSSSFGGGLVLGANGLAQVLRCRFADNTCHLAGGGMMDFSDDLQMVNCVAVGNHAGTAGGGVNLSTIFDAQLVNCTLANNSAVIEGGGVQVDFGANASLENGIAWGNTAPLGAQIAITATSVPTSMYVASSDIQGGQAGVSKPGTAQLFWVPGNLDVDPRLVEAGDPHLLHSSPCRDAADGALALAPDDDWEGDPRPAGAGIDMGADEFTDKLYITGELAPGGAITVKLLGTPGALVKAVIAGLGLIDPPLHGAFGDWYLAQPALPIVLFQPLSADGLLVLPGTLPASLPGPYAVYLQAFVGGQLSDVATLAVE